MARKWEEPRPCPSPQYDWSNSLRVCLWGLKHRCIKNLKKWQINLRNQKILKIKLTQQYAAHEKLYNLKINYHQLFTKLDTYNRLKINQTYCFWYLVTLIVFENQKTLWFAQKWETENKKQKSFHSIVLRPFPIPSCISTALSRQSENCKPSFKASHKTKISSSNFKIF